MKARVQKWGNSLAVRIPKTLAVEAELTENTPVKLSLIKGRLTIEAVPDEPPTIEELVAGITDENLHPEWDMGRPVGKEIW